LPAVLHALIMLAASEGEEPSKTAFYIAGGLLVVYAVIIGFIGIRSADFPAKKAQARGVMALSAVLVAAAMASAVLTG
jgi:hypothetical protein